MKGIAFQQGIELKSQLVDFQTVTANFWWRFGPLGARNSRVKAGEISLATKNSALCGVFTTRSQPNSDIFFSHTEDLFVKEFSRFKHLIDLYALELQTALHNTACMFFVFRTHALLINQSKSLFSLIQGNYVNVLNNLFQFTTLKRSAQGHRGLFVKV